MPAKPLPALRSLHRALADPLRIRLLEALWVKPRSAKELAKLEGLPTERLYYHLGQMEQAQLVHIAEYRPLPGGKVERVYAATTAEPPGDEATPEDLARFLGAVLEATRADVTSACLAKEAGEDRRMRVHRTALRLSAAQRDELEAHLTRLLDEAEHDQDDDGTWTRVLVTMVDLQDRNEPRDPHRTAR
ncbi:MAG TPA: winged helix-turn-helix domain-containing protein [Streptosporangiaceae bacterium]|nr:winged helix-turn-helix domain-containing protein [Streptosporangiaceae bacterium]